MGFRSTICTFDYSNKWPEWFRDKYKYILDIGECGAIYSKGEFKVRDDICPDIQTTLNEQDWFDRSDAYVVVFLSECGGVTRVVIRKDTIEWHDMDAYASRESGGMWHHYCDHCYELTGDIKNA